MAREIGSLSSCSSELPAKTRPSLKWSLQASAILIWAVELTLMELQDFLFLHTHASWVTKVGYKHILLRSSIESNHTRRWLRPGCRLKGHQGSTWGCRSPLLCVLYPMPQLQIRRSWLLSRIHCPQLLGFWRGLPDFKAHFSEGWWFLLWTVQLCEAHTGPRNVSCECHRLNYTSGGSEVVCTFGMRYTSKVMRR